MSSQADVRSIEGLKSLRVALALFADDALGALGAVDMEARRAASWLHHDRRAYWAEQIKRRRERVAAAKAEVFRRKLQKTDDHSPAMSEPKEILRKAEAGLREAEAKAALVKTWEPALQQALFEYRGTTRRIKSLAAADAPRAMLLLGRLVDALEAYQRVALPTGGGGSAGAAGSSGGVVGSTAGIAEAVLAAEPPDDPEPEPGPGGDEDVPDGAPEDPGVSGAPG